MSPLRDPRPNPHDRPLLNFAGSPILALDSHLNSSKTPVLTMVMASRDEAGPRLRLLLGEHGKDTENDGHARVERHAHQALRHRVGNVLEVHRLALDQHANGDQGVEGACRHRRCSGIAQRGEVGRRAAQEIAGAGADTGRGGLDLRC